MGAGELVADFEGDDRLRQAIGVSKLATSMARMDLLHRTALALD
jgi:hypothetical protein